MTRFIAAVPDASALSLHRNAPIAISLSPAAGGGGRTPIPTASLPLAKKSPVTSTGSSAITKIVTSKEWVLPARPKPGRKPSVDTPVTKRKAQNRAAQRAFRERRATRVQELEEKLAEFERDRALKEQEYLATIHRLQQENAGMNHALEEYRRQWGLEKDRTPMASSFAAYQVTSESVASILNESHRSPAGATPAYTNYQQISPAPSSGAPSPNSACAAASNAAHLSHSEDDCGACAKDDCVCETIGIKRRSEGASREVARSALKRHKVEVDNDRRRELGVVGLKGVEEIDFTAQYSAKPRGTLEQLGGESHTHAAAFEMDCGFCSDDTPCVCREAAKEALNLSVSLGEGPKRPKAFTSLPPLQFDATAITERSRHGSHVSLPVMHPGPNVEFNLGGLSNSVMTTSSMALPCQTRESDSVGVPLTPVTVALNPRVPVRPLSLSDKQSKLTALLLRHNPPIEEKKEGCTGNPGACSLCQVDPMSTLFCTTIATKNAVGGSVAAPSPEPTEDAKNTLTEILSVAPKPNLSRVSSSSLLLGAAISKGVFIPVPDAYRTLSRHENFSKMDFNYMVGKLTTRGMSVEAGSVANVLRELDRRLHN